MKKMTAIILGGCLFLGGCSGGSGSDGKATHQKIDRAKALSDLTLVTEGLMTFYTQHQSYPKTLNELKLDLYYPQDISYDPKTGKTRSKTYPDL